LRVILTAWSGEKWRVFLKREENNTFEMWEKKKKKRKKRNRIKNKLSIEMFTDTKDISSYDLRNVANNYDRKCVHTELSQVRRTTSYTIHIRNRRSPRELIWTK
jgi:hypothetical protein